MFLAAFPGSVDFIPYILPKFFSFFIKINDNEQRNPPYQVLVVAGSVFFFRLSHFLSLRVVLSTLFTLLTPCLLTNLFKQTYETTTVFTEIPSLWMCISVTYTVCWLHISVPQLGKEANMNREQPSFRLPFIMLACLLYSFYLLFQVKQGMGGWLILEQTEFIFAFYLQLFIIVSIDTGTTLIMHAYLI